MTLPIILKEKIKLNEPILPSQQLTDNEIELTLSRWVQLLHMNRIHIVFNQTPVRIREQYDYLATSFFNMELPPHPYEMHFCFMYDRVEQELPGDELDQMVRQMLEDVFRKQESNSKPCLNRRLQFNEFENLSEPEFNYLVKSYAEKKPTISQCRISIQQKKYEGGGLVLHGKYQIGFAYAAYCDLELGGWTVVLNNVDGNWAVQSLYIDGK
ncbi:MAG: hypothetical protein RLZZ49_921 [Bacteroidota bacterium]|jgi:hypothetical protein